MNLTEQNQREKEFHNKLHSSGKERSQNKFYKSLYQLYEDFITVLKIETHSKNVLDYGCGVGNFAREISNFEPKKIIAIDISEEAIKKAKNKTSSKIIDYRVENCESLSLNSETFDVVYGSGILHHLDLNKSLTEVNRVLKKNGKMIFVEPLATNPLINLYRRFTPNARSHDEHPFKFEDIKLIESIFNNVEIKYYGFFTLIFFPFYRSPKDSGLFRLLNKMDRFVLKIKYFKFLAWSVLIEAKKN